MARVLRASSSLISTSNITTTNSPVLPDKTQHSSSSSARSCPWSSHQLKHLGLECRQHLWGSLALATTRASVGLKSTLVSFTPHHFPELIVFESSSFKFNLLSTTSMLVTNTVAVGAFVLEAFLYGIYLILFGCTICLLWNRRQHSTRGTTILIGTALCLLFMLATAHMITSLSLLFLNVLTAPSMSGEFQYTGRGGIVHFTIALKAIWIATMVIADSLIVWRGWVLWNRKLWIIPIFASLEISLIVCAIGQTFASLQRPYTNSLKTAAVAWYIGLIVISLFTNVLASGLISFRIYQAGNQMNRVDGHARTKRYRRLLRMYLESGSIYPTVLIVVLCLYFLNSPFWWIVATVCSQISGIMPTLVILVVLSAGRSLSQGSVTDSQESNSNSRSINLPSRRSNDDRLMTTESPYPLTDIENELELSAYERFKSTGLINTTSRSTF